MSSETSVSAPIINPQYKLYLIIGISLLVLFIAGLLLWGQNDLIEQGTLNNEGIEGQASNFNDSLSGQSLNIDKSVQPTGSNLLRKTYRTGVSDDFFETDDWKQISFNNESYILVKNNGISDAFSSMGIAIKDFDDRKLATSYLKAIFSIYETNNKELFEYDDRDDHGIDNQLFYHMINQRSIDNHISYVGDGGSSYFDRENILSVWLPIRVNGDFVGITSFKEDMRADFRYVESDTARLAVGLIEGSFKKSSLDEDLNKINSIHLYTSTGFTTLKNTNGNIYSITSGGLIFLNSEMYFKLSTHKGYSIKEFTNAGEITTYLKNMFDLYNTTYPSLFDTQNWLQLGQNDLFFKMIHEWLFKNNVSYSGWYDSNGKRLLNGKRVMMQLPISFKGKSVIIWSDLDSKKAGFMLADSGGLYVSTYFKD